MQYTQEEKQKIVKKYARKEAKDSDRKRLKLMTKQEYYDIIEYILIRRKL